MPSSADDHSTATNQPGSAGQNDASTVRSVQQALKDKGFDAGAIDGQMGPSTEKALRDFQQANGIPQSGVLDQKTLEALGVDENGIQSGAASASQNSGTSASQNGGVSAYPKSGASASGAIGTRDQSGASADNATLSQAVAGQALLEGEFALVEDLPRPEGRTAHDQLERPPVRRRRPQVVEARIQLVGGEVRPHVPTLSDTPAPAPMVSHHHPRRGVTSHDFSYHLV